MNDIIRIGTRKSALALIQTQLVADELRQVCPGIQVEIVTKDTLGDRILDKPLQEFGGKGVFVSEFEQAIQEGVIDLAVHSAKDLPMELAQGLDIAAVSAREDPRDVLVTLRGRGVCPGSTVRVGTSSPRRQLQVQMMQKTLWPEAKTGTRAHTLTQSMDHGGGRLCLDLERRVLKLLDAGCHEPIGIYSVLRDGQMEVWGVSSRNGEVKRVHLTGGTLPEDVEKLALEAWKGLM